MPQQTTLQIARGYVRAGSDDCDEASLTDVVNKVRRIMYGWYSEMNVPMDIVECYAVKQFRDADGSCYQGITLGADVANVEAMWWNDWPVQLRSEWREWQQGIMGEWQCGLQKFDLPGVFSTITDMPCGQPVRFQCYSTEDIGKQFSIRGTTVAGIPFSGDYKLALEPQQTPVDLLAIRQQGGIIKEPTVGRVGLTTDSGLLLGLYEPYETVPSYRRLKITGLCHGCQVVNVRSARRYYPLVGPNDIVEIDNEPAFDAMARYIRSFSKSDRDSNSLQLERDYIATAKRHIMGDKARETGKNTRQDLNILTPGRMPFHRRLSSSW